MKQNASTAGMIYRIDEQLSSISQFVTLEPGDVVSPVRRRVSVCRAANFSSPVTK